ncbi:MAG: DUF3108 domain-containing protein [Planctomycetes bacterium]|nr:DUF3108 domain-containing protein [Planctomycetota bacterium]
MLKITHIVFSVLLSVIIVAGSCKAADEAKDAKGADEKLSEVKPTVRTIADKYREIKNQTVKLSDFTKVGEELTYRVSWKGIPAGTITLRTKRTKRVGDRKALNFEISIQSNDFLSMIYPVSSTITSLADTEDGRSYLFKRDLKEGRRRVDDRLQFDYDYKSADGRVEPVALYSKIKNGTTKSNTPLPIPGPMQDSLSIVYYMRSLKFNKEGDTHELLLGGHKRVDVVNVTAMEFVKKKTAVGTFDCVVVEPKGDEDSDSTNIVSTKGTAMIYLEKHTGIPVYMTVAVPFGNAVAVLSEHSMTDLDKYKLDDKEAGKAKE